MEETSIDIYGRQHCPNDNNILKLIRAWSYNNRIHTDSFNFHCEKCWHNFVGNAKETEMHQDGIEAAELYEKVLTQIETVVEYKKLQNKEKYD